MIRLLVLGVCCVLWLLGGVSGCTTPLSASPRDPVTKTVEQTQRPVFMWRTQGESAVVYLLGSIHVGTKDMYPLDPRIEAAFTKSDVLVLEIDMDEEAEAAAALAFVEMALLPKEQELDDLLDDETRTLLHQRLDELGLEYDNLKMFRPWFVALTLEMQAFQDDGYLGEYGIDRHFQERAVKENMTILELESVAEQAALFATLTQDAEADDLKMALDDDGIDELAPLKEQWLRGETTLIAAEVEEMRNEYPDAYEALYAARNRKMVRTIEDYLKTSKQYFVVVGGAHMVGEEGIVELLRKRGYTVTQQ